MSELALPPVEIGLVVYNGAAHLEEAVESILNQSFGAFHLRIYDNASDDGTAEIAASFARRDPRVRVHRHASNIGAIPNFLFAAREARSEYFAWAAHDDVREPEFLDRLHAALSAAPQAALACCEVRDMQPDGTRLDVRTDTLGLRSTTGGASHEALTAAQRLRMFFGRGPGTPICGLFRRSALVAALGDLPALRRTDGRLGIAWDIQFLAAYFRRHHICFVEQPLLNFRRGGHSHRFEAYGGLAGYLREAGRFAAGLSRASRGAEGDAMDRFCARLGRWSFTARYLAGAPMRRALGHYASQSWPRAAAAFGSWRWRTSQPMRALATRAKRLPGGATIALFGAGKHTRRALPALKRIFRRQQIIAVIDDHALPGSDLGGIPVVRPDVLIEMRPNILVVSSDAYEEPLARRAASVAPAQTTVWRIYQERIAEGG